MKTMTHFFDKMQELLDEVGKIIIGQDDLKRDIIIALFAGGHILLEGAPGLAKTRTVGTFSEALDLKFQRIQFTPDLLPSDLIGAKIYNPEARLFEVKKGPIFANFVLADEINRAPSKVQSALLEAMEEKQVSIGDETFALQKPFIVLATQNPLEQEGTFQLPEAQLDRFLFKTIVSYPTQAEEREILTTALSREITEIQNILNAEDILYFQKELQNIQVSEEIIEYIGRFIGASRNNDLYPEIEYGASPRASLALLKTSKIFAALQGRNFVIPEDVKALSLGVLRHRIILSYEALADGINPDEIIKKIGDNTKI